MLKKRIAIDARFYGTRQKGLGRYCQKLIENLEKIDSDKNEYYVMLTRRNFGQYLPKKKNFHKLLADYHWYSLAEQIFFPLFLHRHRFDLVHFCHFNVPILFGGKFVVTIHDLILFHHPTLRNTTLNKYFYFFKLWAYRLTIRRAARKALKIIAVSEFTKQDIIKSISGINKNNIVVTLEGCENGKVVKIIDDAGSVLAKYGISMPYLLYVGNAYPHKNLERLCRAFRLLERSHSQLSLVLAGGNDFFYERLKSYVSKNKINKIIFTGHVSDSDLDAVYRKAELYVFPSLYEGFGLPPLEAICEGTPVASSNRTSMPEILDKAAAYFDPENVWSIANAITKTLGNNKLSNSLLSAGKERIKLFRWDKMASQTLKVYDNCLK